MEIRVEPNAFDNNHRVRFRLWQELLLRIGLFARTSRLYSRHIDIQLHRRRHWSQTSHGCSALEHVYMRVFSVFRAELFDLYHHWFLDQLAGLWSRSRLCYSSSRVVLDQQTYAFRNWPSSCLGHCLVCDFYCFSFSMILMLWDVIYVY